MESDKLILDACCGSRMFWFDKHNPLVLFVDKRSETLTAKDKDRIRTIDVKPDVIADFTNLPFEDNSFYMVVFDPPHLKTLGETSWMAKKYGIYDGIEYYAVDCEGLLFHIYEIQKFMRDENIEPRIMSGNFSNKHLLLDEHLNDILKMNENQHYCKTNPNKL